jgi:hypothetical protein
MQMSDEKKPRPSIAENFTAWAERHAEDPDDLRLNAFLTVGELREVQKRLKILEDVANCSTPML